MNETEEREQRDDERLGLVPVTVDPPEGNVCPHT